MGLLDQMKAEAKQEADVVDEGAALEEEAQQEEAPQEQDIYSVIEELGGPTRAQIEDLKSQVGELHLLPLSDEKFFLYRSLKRSEWNGFKAQFSDAGANLSDDAKKEKLVTRCLVWPRLDESQFSYMEAGLVDALYDAISLSSYFLPEAAIANMIIKL